MLLAAAWHLALRHGAEGLPSPAAAAAAAAAVTASEVFERVLRLAFAVLAVAHCDC